MFRRSVSGKEDFRAFLAAQRKREDDRRASGMRRKSSGAELNEILKGAEPYVEEDDEDDEEDEKEVPAYRSHRLSIHPDVPTAVAAARAAEQERARKEAAAEKEAKAWEEINREENEHRRRSHRALLTRA